MDEADDIIRRIYLNEFFSILFNFLLSATLIVSANKYLLLKYPNDQDFQYSQYQYIVILSTMGLSDLVFLLLTWHKVIGGCCSCSKSLTFYHCHWIINIFKITGFLMLINNLFDKYRPMIQIQILILFAISGTIFSIIIHVISRRFYCRYTQNPDYEPLWNQDRLV